MSESPWGSFQNFLLTGQLSPSRRSTLLGPSSRLTVLGKRLASCSTKLEEKKLLDYEIETIELELGKAGLDDWKRRECLLRAMVCSDLGRPSQCAAVQAVKMASNEKLCYKHIGYLSTCALVSRESELRLLLVNTWLKDLSNWEARVVNAALPSVQQLMPRDTLPVLISILQEKLRHKQASVRSKACIVLHGVTEGSSEWQTESRDIALALADDDPTVVSAALNVILQRSKVNPADYVQFVPQLCSIQQLILKGKFAVKWRRRGVAVPQVQIMILKLLTRVGPSSNVQLHRVIKDTLNQAKINDLGGLAVSAEAVSCALALQDKGDLLGETLQTISNFLKSPALNLKYVGIRLFTEALSSIPSDFVAGHQGLLVTLLEHQDLSIQRHMAKLLVLLANPSNVQLITKRLSRVLSNSSDQGFKETLLRDLLHQLELQCSSPDIFYETTIELLYSHPQVNQENTISTLKSSCLNGTKFGTRTDCQRAARLYCRGILSDSKNTEQRAVQFSLWVISNFIDTPEAGRRAFETIFTLGVQYLEKLQKRPLTNAGFPEEVTVLIAVIQSLQSLIVQTGSPELDALYLEDKHEETWFAQAELNVLCAQFLEGCRKCRNTVICFKAKKFKSLLENRFSLRKLEDDGEAQDLTLSFLDCFVAESLKKRAFIRNKRVIEEERPLYFYCLSDSSISHQSFDDTIKSNTATPRKLWTLDGFKDSSPTKESAPPQTTDEQQLASLLFGNFLKS